MVIILASQAEETGSIPVTCSKILKVGAKMLFVSKKAENVYATAYKQLMLMETSDDVKQQKLTSYDYNMVYDIMCELSVLLKNKVCYTLSTSVANWFKRQGFKVLEPVGSQVNYAISVE